MGNKEEKIEFPDDLFEEHIEEENIPSSTGEIITDSEGSVLEEVSEEKIPEVEALQDAREDLEDFNVALDVEELPFSPDAVEEASSTKEENIEKEKKPSSKKLILYLFILLCICIISGVIVFFILNKNDSSPSVQDDAVETPQKPEISEVQKYSLAWDSFWLQVVKDGKEHFVTLSFTTSSTSEKIGQELEHKKLIIRDAIYYYLQHAHIANSKESMEKLKKDIIEIINTYATAGKVDSLGIETFFIQ